MSDKITHTTDSGWDTDVLQADKSGTPISQVMSEHVYTVPKYSDVSLAARVMRNHKIHHVIVTHEGRLVGLLSSFDLLRLVEDHRFVMKNVYSPWFCLLKIFPSPNVWYSYTRFV